MSCLYCNFWDNGYMYGYYCDFSGNKCDYDECQELCCAYEEDEHECDDEE